MDCNTPSKVPGQREWFEGHKNALVKCLLIFSWRGPTRAFKCPPEIKI